MSAVGTDADDSNGCLKFFFQEGDVVAELFGELGLGGELRHIGLPAGEGLIDRFDARLDVVGEVAGELAVHLISCACLDGVEAIEDVGLHHDELGDAIDHDAVAEGYQVNPTTATLTTRNSPILVTQVTNEFARLVEQLGGERTRTDTGAVGLHDAINLANLVGSDAQSCAGSRTDGVAGGDKGIGAEINVEHGTLSTLAEDGLACTQGFVDLMLRIDQVELAQVFDALEPFLLDLGDVIIEVQGLEDGLVTSLMGCILSLEVVEDVAYAQAIAGWCPPCPCLSVPHRPHRVPDGSA